MIKKKEYKQLQSLLEDKLQYYELEIIKVKDVNNKLESDLVSNNNHVQHLTETKTKATTELTEVGNLWLYIN